MTKTTTAYRSRQERSERISALRGLARRYGSRSAVRLRMARSGSSGWPIFLDETNEDDHTYQGRLFWPSDIRDEGSLVTAPERRTGER